VVDRRRPDGVHDGIQRRSVRDVRDLEVGGGGHLALAAGREVVDHGHLGALGQQRFDDVGSDEPGAAGHHGGLGGHGLSLTALRV
jgi:hypothetical protein